MIKLVKGDEQEVGRKSLSEASDASIFPLLEKPLPLSSGSWSLNGYWCCKQCAASVDIKWKWICVEVGILFSGRTHA